MINLTRCDFCPHPNYLESGALGLHLALMHVTQLADAKKPQRCETREHDDSAGSAPVRSR